MDSVARTLLFQLPPETAHELASWNLERLGRVPPLLEGVRRLCRPTLAPRTVWGLEFPNPLGIAAGFDKNATMIDALEALGFGFIEVGTVTLRPQPGNPRPRLFRVPRLGALINRMGFNNDGATVVAARLRQRVERRGTSVEPRAPVLVNIGKNRDVPPEAAASAYAACYRHVGRLTDGAVINVSSPNTPNLRDLQRPEHLEEIIRAVDAERDPRWRPLLVKIAPDLDRGLLREIADVCVRLADGMIATNTTLDHSALAAGEDETGGLSGRPLFERSTSVLRELRAIVGPSYPLIGVGGIDDVESARGKLEAGADLVQAYTGFIYGGPRFARRVVEGLAR